MSQTKNVPYVLLHKDPKVQIFPIYNNWVIKFLKMTFLFLLGTLFLNRTASEKMFLIRTDRVKYIEKKDFSLNELFLRLN
jgi:hypothetical protein